MILARVRVHPFGCFADREVTLTPGLNVVLGPNEAGKSTLFQAVKTAFIRARLSKPKFQQFIARYVPMGGGDTVRVELELVLSEERWLLRRRWGVSPSSELLMPGGGSLADEDAISARLESILPARQGTLWKVLMTGQSELAETLESLRKDPDGPLADLADILRRAVLQTGGVSVERFMARLKEKRDEAFSRWDAASGGPEKGRGIENRWEKGRGTILVAYYAWQEARARWESARAYESGLDEVNARLRAAAAALADRESFVKAHAAAARDARERRTLEAELGKNGAEANAMRSASVEWPVLAARVRELEEAAAAADRARIPLEAERDKARRAEEGRDLRLRHARVQKRAAQAREAAEKLAVMPRLEKKALEELRRASAEVEKLAAGLEAGKLSVTVAGRSGVELVIQEDFAPESRRKIGAGEVVRLRAGSRLRIVHPDMEIEVRSGEADADTRMERAAAARRAWEEKLARLGVADLAEAEERNRAYEQRLSEEAAARKNLEDELAGDTLAGLEASVAALGPEEQTRAVADIAAELATLDAQAKARVSELAEARRRIQEWASLYGTPEKLMDGLVEAKSRETGLRKRMDGLAALPSGFDDAQAFLSAFEKADRDHADLRVKVEKIEGERGRLEEHEPDQSSEELRVLARDAEEAFQTALRQGQALERIAAACADILGQSESGLYDGIRERLEKILGAMTRGRHGRVRMEGSLPAALIEEKGAAVAWDMLSAGTKDSLALALRLAMAEYFIADADGFLMMDDPLVDMDPERQEAAAQALKSFAAKRQLVVFTCHPSAAGLLGGNLIRL